MSGLDRLNNFDAGEALEYLQHCCGSISWAHQMVMSRPFVDRESLLGLSDRLWEDLPFEDRLDAFDTNPRLGNLSYEDTSLAGTWMREERTTIEAMPEEVLDDLKSRQLQYENKFGFTFVADARNKSTVEINHELDRRMLNDVETEVAIASEQQRKLIWRRLESLLLLLAASKH
ncbi:MAG: hypothetical protein HKN43_00870 [Rhodothermales bacterium]|nr:hypothetical protein [Rhodothermales bacterium]